MSRHPWSDVWPDECEGCYAASVKSMRRDESSRAWVEAWKVAHICIGVTWGVQS